MPLSKTIMQTSPLSGCQSQLLSTTTVTWEYPKTMKKRLILILGLSSLVLALPWFPTTHHLLFKNQATFTDTPTFEPFEVPDLGHPDISQGSATR